MIITLITDGEPYIFENVTYISIDRDGTLFDVEHAEDFVLEDELVRCKNCKYWRRFVKEDNDGGCALLEINEGRKPNDYCSKAERKDDTPTEKVDTPTKITIDQLTR